MRLFNKSTLIAGILVALAASSIHESSVAQVRRPSSATKLIELPFAEVQDFWLLPNQLCALESTGVYSCFGHDYPVSGFRPPPPVQPEESIVGLALLPSEVCLRVSDGRSSSVRCGANERYGDPSAAIPLVYQNETDLWNFLVKSEDPYACHLNQEAEQAAKTFFADLDSQKVLIDQGRMTACAIAGSKRELKCISCSGKLLSADPDIVRSGVGETRKGFEFFQVGKGGDTRFGHYAVDSNEVIWPKNPVIQGINAERYKVAISHGQYTGLNSMKWITISDSVTQTHQMMEDPWLYRLADWKMPVFEKAYSREWQGGIWLRSEIDHQGALRLFRNLPFEFSNLDRFPRQVRLLERAVSRSAPKNLKTYTAPFQTFGYPPPNQSDTQGDSGESDETQAPFGELSCAQITLPKTPTMPSKDEVQCWGVDNYGLLVHAPPTEIVETFSASFDGELVQYDVGSHILCGIEKKNSKRKLRCFGIDEKGISGEIYTYDRENVKELATGYRHVSFVTDSDLLIHFNFRNDLSEEISPLSGQRLKKISAHSKHTCVVSDALRGVICETKSKKTLGELLSSTSQSPFKARLVSRGEVGWPIHDLTTSFGQVALISNRGLETWKDGQGGTVLQILSDPSQTTIPSHSK